MLVVVLVRFCLEGYAVVMEFSCVFSSCGFRCSEYGSYPVIYMYFVTLSIWIPCQWVRVVSQKIFALPSSDVHCIAELVAASLWGV